MKTLFLYMQDDLGYFFFEKEGDYSHLHHTFFNVDDGHEEHWDELDKLISSLTESENLQVPTKDWDYFVVVGHCC